MNAILDEAFYCHVGFVIEGQPFVQPMVHARIEELLYIHGSAANRMLQTLCSGVSVCVTVTLLDGLVLARSAFRHSMNYRSVMILGTTTEVNDEEEKRRAQTAVVNHVLPGRASQVRPPNAAELAATTVLRLPITEASAKIRTGPPLDVEEDYARSSWAGVLPLELTALPAIPDARLPTGVPVPDAVTSFRRGRRR